MKVKIELLEELIFSSIDRYIKEKLLLKLKNNLNLLKSKCKQVIE